MNTSTHRLKLAGTDHQFVMYHDIFALKGDPEILFAVEEKLYPQITRISWSTAHPVIQFAQPFVESGWHFFKGTFGNPEVLKLAQNNNDLDFGRILIREEKEIMLDTSSLVISFNEDFGHEAQLAFGKSNDLEFIHSFQFPDNTFLLKASSGKSATELTELFLEEQGRNFNYIEPDFRRVYSHRSIDDPDYLRQWHLGSQSNGVRGNQPGIKGILAQDAWEELSVEPGHGIRIGMIDHGFDLNHEDLDKGISRTFSGYFRDERGQEMFSRNFDEFPVNRHGTECAGLAISRANKIGVRGVAYAAELVAVACLSKREGPLSTLSRAIQYLLNFSTEVPEEGITKNGYVDVICCSLNIGYYNESIDSTFVHSIQASSAAKNGQGIPIFWAVSNEYKQIASNAGHDRVIMMDEVIAVGASNQQDERYLGAWGKALDFLAPGASVFTTVPDNKYNYQSGSSMACAIAAGAGAVLLSEKRDLTAELLRKVLRNTCDQKDGIFFIDNFNLDYGYGRLNLLKAILHIQNL